MVHAFRQEVLCIEHGQVGLVGVLLHDAVEEGDDAQTVAVDLLVADDELAHDVGLDVGRHLAVEQQGVELLLVEGILTRFFVIACQRVHGHGVVGFFGKHLLVDVVGFFFLAVLQVDVAQHNAVAQVLGIFGHKVLHLAESALVIALAQIDAELLKAELFVLAHALFEQVQHVEHPVVVFLLVVDFEQAVQRVDTGGKALHHIFEQDGCLFGLVLLQVELRQGLGVPVIVGVGSYGLFDGGRGTGGLLQVEVILSQLVQSRSVVRIDGKTVLQQVEGSIVVARLLQADGFEEVVVELALLLLGELGHGSGFGLTLLLVALLLRLFGVGLLLVGSGVSTCDGSRCHRSAGQSAYDGGIGSHAQGAHPEREQYFYSEFHATFVR